VNHQGRFGKYGDIKRLDRLRKSGTRVTLSRFEQEDRRATFPRTRKISIRRANLSDIGFISQLSGKVFSVYGPYRSLVTEWFESGSALSLIAVEKGKPVGFAMIGRLWNESEEQNRCELLAIAVDPAAQRRGIGRILLQKMEKEADRLSERVLFLHTAADNIPAQNLFKKMGFAALSVKKHFYPSGQDAVMMMKVL
jgi:ribosomal protein S18 acetylase RimI-like enzyme